MLDSFRGFTVTAALTMSGLLAGCDDAPPPPDPGPRPVKLLEIGEAGAGATREYPGRVKAGKYSEMGFEVPGRVTDFVFTEGTDVDKGAVLAKLDPRDYQARYDSSMAKLAHARSERDRYKEMYDKEVKPYSEYEMRLRSFEVAEADLAEARKALDDTILRAPFDGVMARKLVDQFENVLAKQAVLVMQNDDMLELKVSVPERDLTGGASSRKESVEELTELLSPRVVVSSLPGREFPASMKEIANVADPTTRTFEATFLFEKPADANVLGGMTAKLIVSLIDAEAANGIWIPSTVVVSNDGAEPAVWVVDPETLVVSSRRVKLGDLRGDSVLVTEGLRNAETIAVSGVHSLRDGMTVRRFDR